jgi:hypothetical protein
MNRVMAKRLLQRGMGDGLKVMARRIGGRCVLLVTDPPKWPWQRAKRLVVGDAPTWLEALRQAKSGYMREVL